MSFRGLTLAEILVALALLSVALLTMVAIFTKNLSLAGKTEEMTVATELGKTMLERVAVMEPDLVPVPSYFARHPVNADGFPPSPYPSQTIDGREYEIEVRTTPRGDLVLVEATVIWSRGRLSLASVVRP